MLSAILLAQNGGSAPAGRDNYWQTFIMIGLVLVFFYFILWRPEQKRRKKMEQKRASVKKGDQVTAMGIIGTVERVKDSTLILKMVDNSKIEVVKAAVTDVHEAQSEDSSVDANKDSES